MKPSGATTPYWKSGTIFKLHVKYIPVIAIIALSCFLTSCTSVHNRIREAQKIADKSALKEDIVQGNIFRFVTFQRISNPAKSLHVYIEGDGKAYVTRTIVSKNPTPHNPIALKLAAQDKDSNVLYIARPYQYNQSTAEIQNESRYWTSHRYAEEVVAEISGAIDKIKEENHLKDIVLIGYSGGGTLAALLTTRRKDVIILVTVCGNLDIDYHAELHRITPLEGSLNPADFGEKLKTIKQIHFVGGKDANVPRSVAERYCEKIDASAKNCEIVEIKDNTHHSGWEKDWSEILNNYLD